ncbi:MAG: aminotransferase class V-fold PLP-dependent enzyme [Brachymonas sp.]|nr:aminotransferase class V-fold PLP-dependent enzyme [Brachymonas sp.]
MGERPQWDGDTLAALRSQFPVLQQKINGHDLVYLDNAATTHMPTAVLAAMQHFEAHNRANIHRGVHTLSQRATDDFDAARLTLKRFVGADAPDCELVFTSGTTDALNMVAHGLSTPCEQAAYLQPGDEIIASTLEHHANLVVWQQAARRTGAVLRILQPDAEGRLHTADLQKLLNGKTRVFTVTACANATGERPPYEELLQLAHNAGALTVLDAAQAVSHETLRFAALNADFMAFSGHKMYGPMGTGALVGRRKALARLTPLRFGGDMVESVSAHDARFAELPMRLEGGTPNVPGAVGMAAAAQFLTKQGLPAVDAHVRALREQAVQALSGIKGLRVLALHAQASAIAAFVTTDVHPHDIGTLLDARGIAVRTGHHCAQPLIDHFGVGATTRASFAMYNTPEEVERLAAGVAHALEKLR